MSSIPLRIDSELVNLARTSGALFDRPPTAQIEHWAKLGRVLDSVLLGESVANVKQRGNVAELDRVVALSQSTEGRKKALALIAKHAGPVYETDPKAPDLVVERRADGSTRRGRFSNRQFVPID
jgi:ParD-like antitoxin of type II bacterial toxin-antitoxin system